VALRGGQLRASGQAPSQGSYSVVCDHLGTPLELYDARGAKTWQAQLDSYGAVREGKGKAQDCPFRYQGQYEDAETGLYYNRARYYDPHTGSYISQDPISLFGGIELYSYVSNPTSWVDIFGLDPYHGPKPTYENPGHHQPGHPHFRGSGTEKTSILSKNAEDIYKNAIPDAEGTHWYARSENGEIEVV
jgi:RHS repeat-associated protein